MPHFQFTDIKKVLSRNRQNLLLSSTCTGININHKFEITVCPQILHYLLCRRTLGLIRYIFLQDRILVFTINNINRLIDSNPKHEQLFPDIQIIASMLTMFR